VILFAAWGLRAVTKHILYAVGDGRKDNIWIPGAVYTMQAALRAVVYELHRAGFFLPKPKNSTIEGELHTHIMSDHVLLAATVVGGLSCEAVLVYMSIAHRRRAVSPYVLKAVAAVATVLALLVCIETYYTARYFHPPSEIISGAVLGLVLFQAPLLYLSMRELTAQQEQSTGPSLGNKNL